MTGQNRKQQQAKVVLNAKGLNIDAPGGRRLFQDLSLTMSADRVALIGRNGVGKSTLLETLAMRREPSGGVINCYGEVHMVGQHLLPPRQGQLAKNYMAELFHGLNLFKLDIQNRFSEIGLRQYEDMASGQGFSYGELRKLHLLNARLRRPELLLLDEPTQDLDKTGFEWLQQWLDENQGGLIVSSDDQRILSQFSHFFIADESGCRYFAGSFTDLVELQELEHANKERKYIQGLNRLQSQEAHFRKVSYRRQQKKNQGRVREVGRATPRTVLNAKRSCAQQSQGRLAKVRADKVAAVREFTKASRRALSVDLPMEMLLPQLPTDDGKAIVKLQKVSKTVAGRTLFVDFDLTVGRQRIALVGPNGSGKTTLQKLIMGAVAIDEGMIKVDKSRIGYIAQGAQNWQLQDSLLNYLMNSSEDITPDKAVNLLQGFKFPLALAQRSMRSLAPGERTRAALLCILSRQPAVELLILDEPGNSLDLVALNALKQGLKAWRGGFIIAAHDDSFFASIGIDSYVTLGK